MRPLLPLLAVSLFSSMLTLAAALLIFAPPGRAEPVGQTNSPIIQAQRIDLVDANGTARARLGVDSDGSVGFAILDQGGQSRATLALTNDNSAVIQVRTPQGSTASLSASP